MKKDMIYMSTRKEKLAAKRAEQAKITAARRETKGKPERNYELELKDVHASMQSKSAEIDAYIKLAQDMGLSHKGYGADEHFAGENSTQYTSGLKKLRREYNNMKIKIEAIKNAQDPLRSARRSAEKIERESDNRAKLALMGTMYRDYSLIAAARKPLDIPDGIEVVKRQCAGFILAANSPFRCYHTLDGRSIKCDCVQHGPRDFELSDRAKELKSKYRLIIDESVSKAQEESLKYMKDPHVGALGTIGGFAAGLAESVAADPKFDDGYRRISADSAPPQDS